MSVVKAVWIGNCIFSIFMTWFLISLAVSGL